MGAENLNHHNIHHSQVYVTEWTACWQCGQEDCECPLHKRIWSTIYSPTEEIACEAWDRIRAAWNILRNGDDGSAGIYEEHGI